MSNLDALVRDALHDPLAAARAHARNGGRVIGYVGAEIPVELIIASGAFPVRLPSTLTADCAAADLYLESSFMPEARSIAERYLQGAFDFLQGILLPRSNDSAQRLYYYLCELRARGLRAGPVPSMYDVAKIPRETSQRHNREATRVLAAEVGADLSKLPAAIATRNRRRSLIAAVSHRRCFGAGLRGSEADRICRAADFCEADAFDAALAARLARRDGFAVAPRFLLAGSTPPDERLHVAVEAAGGNVIAEADAHASRSPAVPAIDAAASIEGVADHYYHLRVSTRAFIDRVASIVELAQSAQADGVIIWLVEEEDALIWDLPAQLRALTERGVAALALKRRRWDGGDGALAEIEAFAGRLGGVR